MTREALEAIQRAMLVVGAIREDLAELQERCYELKLDRLADGILDLPVTIEGLSNAYEDLASAIRAEEAHEVLIALAKVNAIATRNEDGGAS